MKKKAYERPTMQVVRLKQTGMLMTSSNGEVPDMPDYSNGGDPLNP